MKHLSLIALFILLIALAVPAVSQAQPPHNLASASATTVDKAVKCGKKSWRIIRTDKFTAKTRASAEVTAVSAHFEINGFTLLNLKQTGANRWSFINKREFVECRSYAKKPSISGPIKTPLYYRLSYPSAPSDWYSVGLVSRVATSVY